MSIVHVDSMGLNSGDLSTHTSIGIGRKSEEISSVPVKPDKSGWRGALGTGFLVLFFTFGAGADLYAGGMRSKDAISSKIDELYEGGTPQFAGAYIGASAGYGWGSSDTWYDRAGNDHLTPESNDSSGYAAALTLGFNYRLNNNVILGVEGDIGIMDISADDKTDLWDGHVWRSQYGGLWGTLRARLGYAFDNMMIYGTGGLAFMETNEFILGDNDATQNTYNEGMHTGWVLGAGVEYALTSNISTKLEYLHMSFPEHTGYTNNEEAYGFDNSVDLIRVGLNYKF